MRRNIWIAYVLCAAKHSWFWLGIWVFYYLRFTNYAGIGLLETALIIAMTLSEIPTGAVADLLGKKWTLLISFMLQAVGLWTMAIATNFLYLIGGVFMSGIGNSFYSGTFDALVYDSLKQENKESAYPKVISQISALALISPAVCGIIGGFLYTVNPSFPFFASAIGYMIALVFCIFLQEPLIDTVKFNLTNFIIQTKQGLRELFKTKEIKRYSFFLLSIGFMVVISEEMLNGFLGVGFGFKETQLGILWAFFYVVSALCAQLTPAFIKLLNEKKLLAIVGLFIAVTFLVSPFLGMVLGGITLLIRFSLETVYNNLVSIAINKATPSQYRATTLSTFNMIKNLPYVLTAYFIGSLVDNYSAKIIAFGLGIMLIVFILLQLGLLKKNS